jgi:dienelactone hydrolase
VALLLALSAGCSADQPTTAALTVDAPEAPADQAVHISVSGLTAGKKVEIQLTTADINGVQWRGHAEFKVASDGTVDLTRDAPLSGTYSGVDGMGLFWSMDPPSGKLDEAWYVPPVPRTQSAIAAQLSVLDGRRILAKRQLTRQWMTAGVTYRLLTLGMDKVVAQLFLPKAGTQPRPGVLYFTGSDGSVDPWAAALLASHGFPAMALAYYNQPGLPPTLTNVPIEYFATAAKLLSEQPGVLNKHVVVAGYSRGTEAALLTAQHYPALVRGALLFSPNNQARGSIPGGGAAWTVAGQPVPFAPIPVDHIAGPVLAVAGGHDGLWASRLQSEQLMLELDEAGGKAAHRVLEYPDAGHYVGGYPFTPQGTRSQKVKGTGDVEWAGGTTAANEAARADSWPQVLQFLQAVS